MKRSEKDGNQSGLKQDKFRNSRYEISERPSELYQYQSQSQGANTIGGKWAENRGHRTANDQMTREHYQNPFENESLEVWNRRQGLDEFYRQKSFRPGRQGGALIGSESDHRGKGPKGYQREDEKILEEVNEMLYLSTDVDASHISVKVKDGIIYLAGSVEDRQMKKMAELEVENISGVHDVQNLLSIKGAS